MAIEIGVAYLSIVPSTKGMIRDIKRSLNSDGRMAAQAAGRTMGQNLGQQMNAAVVKSKPTDALDAAVKKSQAEVNRLSQAYADASKSVADAGEKARIANARMGEALSRSRTNQSTMMNLQRQLAKANDDLAKAQNAAKTAGDQRSTQLSDLARKSYDLQRATKLVQMAEETAAKSRQSILDRFNSRFRSKSGSGGDLVIGVDVDGNAETVHQKVRRITQELERRHKIELNVDVDRGVLRNVSNAIRRSFATDAVTGVTGALGGVASAFGKLAKKIFGLIPGTWIILGTLIAIGVVTFGPLLGSMTQLLGLLALIPAAAMSAAAAIAAIVVGSQGVFKAIGAGLKAPAKGGGGGGGGGNGRQLERAQKQAARAAVDGARQIAEAERGLARAQKDARKAQDELNKARREASRDLDDMNDRLAQSHMDEEGAILGVRRAYESMRETMGSADATGLDRAEARLAYKESIAQLQNTRKENKRLAEEVGEANRKGVDGHESVAAAQERVESSAEGVEDAQRAVADAVENAARAQEDAADAMMDAATAGAAGAAAADEYADALDDLTPSAREFVETILSLRDAWGEVRRSTQEALFRGMGPALKTFADTYFPIFEKGLSGIAAAFNDGFLKMFDDLQNTGVQASWAAIFANLAEGTVPLMDGLRSLTEVFTDIALIGSSYFPEIGESFKNWADGIRDFINAKPETVHEWIQDGITAFGRMKETIKQVTRLLYAIFSPSVPDGDNMWDKINETLESWANTLGNKENQEALIGFFEDALIVAKTLKDTIETTAKMIRGFQSVKDYAVGNGRRPRDPEEPLKSDKPGGRASDFSFREWAEKSDVDSRAKGGMGHDNIAKGTMTALDWVWIPLAKGGQKLLDAAGVGDSTRTGPEQKPTGIAGGLDGVKGTAPASLKSNSGAAKFRTGGDTALDTSGVSVAEDDTRSNPQKWAEQFRTAGESIAETWNTIVTPVKDGWNTGWGAAQTKFGEFKDSASTKWSELSTGVQGFYNTHVLPTFNRFAGDGTLLGSSFGVVTSLMKGDWSGMGENLRSIVDDHIRPAFDRLKGFAENVQTKFKDVAGGIKERWEGLKGDLARVINWIIRNVWNGGFVRAWEAARVFLPIPEATEMPTIPGYAQGGRVDGKGTSTSDSILARLSRGEHVWDAMDVSRAGGHGTVYAIRALIEKGVPFTWNGAEALAARGKSAVDSLASARLGKTGDLGLPGFARGGAVLRKRGGAQIVKRAEPEPAWIGQLARGHEYAQTVAPAPYLLGASSGGRPGGLTDCSGFMSEIADVILGGPGGTRQWATGSFPGPQAGAWTSGLGPGFSVGIVHGGGAHTAGTLSGVRNYGTVNVESGGGTGQGATYGGAAQGADGPSFTEHHHMKIGADGSFESAGGPSPEQQRSVLKKLLSEIFGKVIDPIGDAIAGGFNPPPHFDAVPGVTFDHLSESIEVKTFDIVDSLTDSLRAVYDEAQKVKDIVGNVVSNVTGFFRGGLLRDTGGVLPTGTSLIRNETGKPEQILNWEQIQAIQNAMRDAMRITRMVGTEVGREDEAEAIADAINVRLEETDWVEVGYRIDGLIAQLEKVGLAAGETLFDDALDVFGVRGGRKRFGEYEAFYRAVTGQPDLAGVPSPSTVIAGDYGFSRTPLPELESQLQTIETKVPPVAESTGSAVKDQVRQSFAAYGWDKEPFWSATDWIVNKESSWDSNIKNPTSTAFGLFQFLDSTWAETGFTKSNDPTVQAAAGAKYIKNRYGDPVKAKAFHEQNGWYDRGGLLKPGTTLAQNDSGKDELILTNEQWRNAARTAVEVNRMSQLSTGGNGSRQPGGDTINIHATDLGGAVSEFRRREARKAQRFVGVR